MARPLSPAAAVASAAAALAAPTATPAASDAAATIAAPPAASVAGALRRGASGLPKVTRLRRPPHVVKQHVHRELLYSLLFSPLVSASPSARPSALPLPLPRARPLVSKSNERCFCCCLASRDSSPSPVAPALCALCATVRPVVRCLVRALATGARGRYVS
jgi:hypothetical protein